MNAWLLLPTIEKLGDVGILMVFVAFVVFVIGAFFKWIQPTSGGISNGKLFFNFSSKKKKKQTNCVEDTSKKAGGNVSSLSQDNPALINEIRFIISKTYLMGRSIHKIEEISTIRSQMNSAQAKVDLITAKFFKEYQESISKKQALGIPNLEFSLKVFEEFMTRIVKSDILNVLKRMYKENGLDQIPDETYEEVYCRDHIKVILDGLHIAIRHSLPSNLNPSISEVCDIFKRNESSFYTYLKDALIEAKDIAEKAEEEIEKIRKAFNKDLVDTFSIEGGSECL